jgi:hypothetical protein
MHQRGHVHRGILLALAVTGMLCIGPGCMYRPVQVSPSLAPVDASRPMVRYKPIQGEACNPVLFYAIPLGDNSLIQALWDMKRLVDIDGYVEVSVEEKVTNWVVGHTVCTIVTAYPFTYGEQPRAIGVRGRADMPSPQGPATSSSRSSSGGSTSGGATTSSGSQPNSRTSGGGGGTSGGGASSGSAAGGGGSSGGAAAPAEPSGPDAATCQAECKRFGKLAGTTDLIRKVVTERCVGRCNAGDAPYFACVQGAQSVRDVKSCNAK